MFRSPLVTTILRLACVVGTLAPCALAQTITQQKVYAFFTSWSVYARNFHIPDVPANKITHLVYAFAKVENGKLALGDPYADTEKFYTGDSWAVGALRGSFRRMQVLKTKHAHLKTLIAVGGANASAGFSSAVSTVNARQAFARSIVDFVVRYDFDGVDIDWEWPGDGPDPKDPTNFTLFIAELRNQLDKKGTALSRTFELAIDAPASPQKAAKLELAKLGALVDTMNLVTFDYFTPSANQTQDVSRFTSPLHEVPGDPSPAPLRALNAANTVELYANAGVPRAKMLLGLPFYARGFAGISGGTNGLFARYTGPTAFGTWGPGVFDYDDLAANYVNKNGYSLFWNDGARAAHLFNKTAAVMIPFETARSVREKAWLAASRGLGGAMVWELSADRNEVLLSEIETVVLRQPILAAGRAEVSTTQPTDVSLRIGATSQKAGKLYMILGSLTGTHPGLRLPGGTWPINLDAFALFMLNAPNSSLFQATIGFLDANGRANAAVGFGRVPTLPTSLIGQRLALSAWVFDSLGRVDGVPSNAADVFFKS